MKTKQIINPDNALINTDETLVNTDKAHPKRRIRLVHTYNPITKGHSVCNSCGKDMPVVWDTVCSICRFTFCYDCSVERDGRWYCEKHA